jgi:hypothetical protein
MEKVPDSKKQSVEKEWFNSTTLQLTKHQEEKASYGIYVKDLEDSNQKLKEEMKEMILRKKDTEMEMMLKFKEVLNTKKLKIRRLIAKGNSDCKFCLSIDYTFIYHFTLIKPCKHLCQSSQRNSK